MLRSNKLYIIPGIVLLVLGTLLGMQHETTSAADGTMEALRKLEDAFIVINRQYVSDVDSKALAENAITSMLKKLDPHSVYISAEEAAEVQEGYQGSFGGIGIWFEIPRNDDNLEDDTVRVVSTISEGPSEAAGVMAGDRIIQINDSSAVGFTTSEVTRELKGPIGTKVKVTVKRRGAREPIHFELTRDRIPLYTVDTSYMMDQETGYIRVSRFAMTTYDEFVEHLTKLREQGMERLILDLRSNPGGIMEAAIRMVDEILADDQMIVYTQGRSAETNNEYRSTGRGAMEHQPVIVLVNEYSASASEIVAGALQDHDRALIVGQRTFGKGLVQHQFPLSDGSFLQMTVARYYTPAGRLIQTAYEDGDQKNYYESKFATLDAATYNPASYIENIPDSLRFVTDRGRHVFGGGGILPDYIVQPDTTKLLQSIVMNALDLRFARQWFIENEPALLDRWSDRQEDFVSDFRIEPAVWDEFWEFAGENDIHVEPGADEAAKDVFSPEEVAESRNKLETILKARIGQELYGSRAWFLIYKDIDHELNEAMKLWDRAEVLADYHAPSGRGSSGR